MKRVADCFLLSGSDPDRGAKLEKALQQCKAFLLFALTAF